ncbi:DUF7144 family membrane protein [Streptomyces albireticuli]|uniref:DUF7144 domain-containing protein n=1 Tax=Streptomyces albireticuli TaxID=1940 RepID=A0A2A2D8Q0_9ACTN|nr:hypothetical protein [Streptomyces albireticuli]MCD9196258.1 hypothetical protein [Streptomyces albireticuli]PAU47904.1 hypothetical protein CK936_16130 [Streptomyces albireticuli]
MSSMLDHQSEHAQTAAAGLTVFAAVMLLIAGFLDVFRGVSAIVNDTVYVSAPDYVYKFSLAGWGWVHLFLGIAAIMVGVGLFKVSTWARVLGIAIAALLLISNFLFIPYYPLWSIVVMALCAFVIWGLCVVRQE